MRWRVVAMLIWHYAILIEPMAETMTSYLETVGVLTRKADFDKAIADFSHSIQINPTSPGLQLPGNAYAYWRAREGLGTSQNHCLEPKNSDPMPLAVAYSCH